MSDQQPPAYGEAGPGEPTPGAGGAPEYGGYGAYGTTGTTETVAPPARSKRGIVIGAGAAVLAVVAGAAVYATTTLSGGGRQPDELVPKSTFAYVKIDLDPAANQKLAARSFFGKFPELRDKLGNDDDNVFENVFAELVKDDDVDYRRDIQPWFDNRVGVAAFPVPGNEPQVVGVLRSKDDTKAKESLDRLMAKAKEDGDDVVYRISRGYVVLGEQAGVDEALRATEKESLSDNEFYGDDVDKLDGDQVVVGWADIGGGFDALKSQIPNAGLIPNVVTDQLKGRVVAGLHLTNDYAEVQGFSIGAGTDRTLNPTPRTEILTSLPADTLGALSINGLATGLGELGKGAGLDLDALAGEFLQGTGLSLTRDIIPTLGDETVLAVGGGADFTTPEAGLVTRPTDAARAQESGAKIAQLLSFFGVEVSSEVDGDRFVLATPEDYVERLAGGDGGLGEAPRFSKAMGDLNGAAFAAYVDLAGLRAGPAPQVEEGFGAAGIVAGRRGAEAFFRMRLVAE